MTVCASTLRLSNRSEKTFLYIYVDVRHFCFTVETYTDNAILVISKPSRTREDLRHLDVCQIHLWTLVPPVRASHLAQVTPAGHSYELSIKSYMFTFLTGGHPSNHNGLKWIHIKVKTCRLWDPPACKGTTNWGLVTDPK